MLKSQSVKSVKTSAFVRSCIKVVHTVVVFVKLKTKVKIVKAKTFVFVRSCIRVVHTDVVFVKLKVKVLKVLKPLSLYEAV